MKNKTVKRLKSELDKWVKKPLNTELLCEQPKKKLDEYVKGNVKTPLGTLLQMSWWLGQFGAQRVLHEDLSGWSAIHSSLHYLALDERTLFAKWDNRTAAHKQVVEAIFILFHAIIAREDEIANWFGNRLILSLQEKDKRIKDWKQSPLFAFALELFSLWKKIPLKYDAADVSPLGIYQKVLDSWSRPDEFANSLQLACEYHLQQSFDDSDDDTQVFFIPLYDLFPVEILAIKRIRTDQGLPMPRIDHPLWQTPLANPPFHFPSVKDELLEQVSKKICKDFGISDPWK